MKILIIDDELAGARLTAMLLFAADREVGRIESVFLATDLEGALERLEEFEAVLCDGNFPSRTGEPARRPNWPEVLAAAQKPGARFVLYSGDPEAVEAARRLGVPAFLKPAPAETLYQVLASPSELIPGVERQAA